MRVWVATRYGRWLQWLLPLALLVVTSLGQWHAVVHAPQLTQPAGIVAASLIEPGDPLGGLFSGHDDDGQVECRLFDQSSHLDGLTTMAPVSVPPAGIAAWGIAVCELVYPRWFAPFLARAPPPFR